MKRHQHFPIRRKKRFARSKIFPDEWQRDITGRVFRLALVDLDFADLQGLAFRGQVRLEIHLVAAKKNRRHVQSVRRIIRVDVRLERLEIRVTTFLQLQLQFA